MRRLEERAKKLTRDIYKDLSVWQKVQLSRHPDRPYFLDYADRLFDDLVELHGDRAFGDDPAIIAGFATFDGRSVAVIGQQKGRTTKDKLHRNFGMAHPEGYRKACRVMELADRFERPVLTFIDTPGAYPGLGAEERGQSEAIGQSLLTMSPPRRAGDRDGDRRRRLGRCARSRRREPSAHARVRDLQRHHAGGLRVDPLARRRARAEGRASSSSSSRGTCSRLGVVDEVVEEPHGGAHRDHDAAASLVGEALRRRLREIGDLDRGALVEDRYAKFRAMGAFQKK